MVLLAVEVQPFGGVGLMFLMWVIYVGEDIVQ
jgi:hypothetical protein